MTPKPHELEDFEAALRAESWESSGEKPDSAEVAIASPESGPLEPEGEPAGADADELPADFAPSWRKHGARPKPERGASAGADLGALLDSTLAEHAHAAPTVPPPVPVGDYVNQMMQQAPISSLRPGMLVDSPAIPPAARVPTLVERPRPLTDMLEQSFDRLDAFTGETSRPAAGDLPDAAAVFDHEPLRIPTGTHRSPDQLLDDLDDLDALPEALRSLGGAVGPTPVVPAAQNQRHATLGELSMAPSTEEARVATISDIPLHPDTLQEGGELGSDLDAAMGGELARSAAPDSESDRIARIQDRFAVGDYSGSLALAEMALEHNPSSEQAKAYVASCREMLLQMYSSRVGDRSQTPRIIMGPEQLRWLTLDHRGGFLLSCIDGMSSIDEILDVSGMPEFDAMRILCELVDQGVVQIGRPPRPTRR